MNFHITALSQFTLVASDMSSYQLKYYNIFLMRQKEAVTTAFHNTNNFTMSQ